MIASGPAFEGGAESFDVAISCECLEHNPEWRATVENMMRMLRPGGALILTCTGYGREEHRTSRTTPEHSPNTVAIGWEHYRNLGRRELLTVPGLLETFPSLFMGGNWRSCDFYVVGIKETTESGFGHLAQEINAWLAAQNRRPRSLLKRLAFMAFGQPAVDACRGLESWASWRLRS